MKRGYADKKRRQESAANCRKQRDARTDIGQASKLNAGNYRAVKERARLLAKYEENAGYGKTKQKSQ